MSIGIPLKSATISSALLLLLCSCHPLTKGDPGCITNNPSYVTRPEPLKETVLEEPSVVGTALEIMCDAAPLLYEVLSD